ncbi:MAG: hypothetical protein GC138_04520 [Gammaproteobacteria bacterium]|nr:hypothetical protein [Gammaproteobacteria bacterium]
MDELAASGVVGEDMPKWDVALEALLVDEARLQTRPLNIEDFKGLAARYQIRFDDIMATVLELTVHGLWGYMRADGVIEVLSRKKVDGLYKQGRLYAEDLASFDGGWYPRDNALADSVAN